MFPSVSVTLYYIQANRYLVDAQPWGAAFPAITQTSHIFRVLHTAVEAQMTFLHPPVLVLGSNYPSIDLVSQ
jgi:hypothetical protein